MPISHLTAKGQFRHQFRKEYDCWVNMRDRCNNPRSRAFHLWGGRGIRICKRWDEFEKFIEDMGKQPPGKFTLDRIDVNGNYTPKNCRWADRKEQARNRRDNTMLTYKGETKCMMEWSEILGIHVNRIIERLQKGWSVDKTLSTDPKDYHRNRPARSYTHKGVTKSLVKWAKDIGISMTAVTTRLERGWSIKRALFTPRRKQKMPVRRTKLPNRRTKKAHSTSQPSPAKSA